MNTFIRCKLEHPLHVRVNVNRYPRDFEGVDTPAAEAKVDLLQLLINGAIHQAKKILGGKGIGSTEATRCASSSMISR